MVPHSTQHARRSLVAAFAPGLALLGLLAVGAAPQATQPLEEAVLTALDGGAEDEFGYAVAVDGSTAVVGAPFDDDGGADSGSAYVFTRSGGTWSQQAKLTASDAEAEDEFGHTVAVDGDTTVVGAPWEDGDGEDDNGAAYVFTRSGSTWSPQAKLTASDSTTNVLFGSAVAVSGESVLVGKPRGFDPAEPGGSAFVFVRSGSTWSQQAKLAPRDPTFLGYFGDAVALDGDTALVGAGRDDDSSGSAYVFTRSGTTWSQQAKLIASDAAANDRFGQSVDVHGDTAVVGAFFDDDAGSSSGSAYVFSRNGFTWHEQAKLTAADAAGGEHFGYAVALAGDATVVGARFDSPPGEAGIGSAYLFSRSGTAWTERARLTASFAANGDLFGSSVAMGGGTVVVGAVLGDSEVEDSGTAYVFHDAPHLHNTLYLPLAGGYAPGG